MSTSIMFKGQEVKNPAARIIVATLAILGTFVLGMVISLVTFFCIMGFIVAAFVITVPLDFILRLCGRRGLYVRERNDHAWTNTGAFRHH